MGHKTMKHNLPFLKSIVFHSVLILADIALSYDDQLAEAYTLRGVYNQVKGNNAKAIEEFDKAIKLNPKSAEAYFHRGNLYKKLGKQRQFLRDYQIAARLKYKPAQDYLRSQGIKW